MVAMTPIQLYKNLADETRLKIILLIFKEQELCVCELTQALGLSQPKISRHLAQLKKYGLVTDRRVGKWVFYQLSEQNLDWQQQTISLCFKHNQEYIENECQQLLSQGNRPNRQQQCC